MTLVYDSVPPNLIIFRVWQLRPLGCRIISVPCDEYGMSAEALRKSLSSRWTPADAKDPNSDIPKFMYVIPTGSNPAGTSMTLERKKNIYQVSD